jgi:hypothetical protein
VLVTALLILSDRSIGYLELGAAVSAAAALLLAFPMRAGRAWGRIGLFVAALVGVLCAPATANAVGSGLALVLGGALVVAWAGVIGMLVRGDVREYVVLRSMRG